MARSAEQGRRRDDPPRAPALRGGAARLRCPDGRRLLRTYRLYRSALDAAASPAERGRGPNLWWPADGSWRVATEVDLAWTYVAGSEALIDAVLADARLEAYRAVPDHREDAGGNRRNAREPGPPGASAG